jgi:two-component system, chemotaxis family, CheB/CheR fusion protein
MKSRASKSAGSAKENPPAQSGTFPVVAIGASAGGLEAYQEFFHALPPDTEMAFVVVQHLDPSHHSMLAEILAKATKMPVEEVNSGAKVKRNRVYVIPPNACLAIESDVFKLTPRGKGLAQQLAVNFFMRSLAEERKSTAIGIVLSGTGADGTSGMEDIKAEGGITFAQEPGSAKYDGMPRSAIDSGCVDFILRPREIAKELVRVQHHPYIVAQEQARAEAAKDLSDSIAPLPPAQKDFSAVLDELRKSSGVDFSQYKPNTIHRRALRRMVILKQDTLGEYARYLKQNSEEGGKLFDDVLIPVTSFFRDFEAFEALKAQVYPAIVKDKGNKGTIRMWAPGCSTGEETYSLAMTLLEFLGDRASSFHVQIFGTDLNDKGIQKARTGLYRESIAEEISPERMARFFVKVDEGYRVNKAVRDMCVFARQNLATDPPFSQMNVVACRNLLIYIQPALQKKIIPILHYALKPSGFLVLGSSESVSSFPELFSTVDKRHKIYGKKAITSRLHYDFVQSYYPIHPAGTQDMPERGLKSAVAAREELDVHAEADRVVLNHHAPVGVVINGAMEVVQFRGRTNPYLEPAPGKPSLNLLKMARNGLSIELRALIDAAQRKRAPANKHGVRFDGNGPTRILDLSVTPLGENGKKANGGRENRGRERERDRDRHFLILFDDVTPQSMPPGGKDTAPRKGKAATSTPQTKREMKRLHQEVADAHGALRSAIESEDAMKEEFQSANEEILSANEELQSTNEELETSKEELQSANEELNTLNAELRSKNNELHDLSNDISNFLNSTRIPVVMLDRDLRIRRLTPTADKLLKVRPSDIGRPIADIRSNIEEPDFERSVAKVLETLQPVEREVRDLEGHWHELGILPYRTQDNKIDGVVLALQDIDAIKAASEQLRKSSEFFRGMLDTVREPLLVLDPELRVLSVNKPFLTVFQVSSAKTVNMPIYDLGNGQWNIPKLRDLFDRVLSNGEPVTDFEIDHDFESIGHRTMLLNVRMLPSAEGAQSMLLLAIDDITERKVADGNLRASEERFRTLFELGPVAVYHCDASGVIQNFNRRAAEMWGRVPAHGDTDEQFCGSFKMFRPDGSFMPHKDCPMAEVVTGRLQEVRDEEVAIERPDGSRIIVVVNIRPLKNERGEVTGGVNCFYDITERKQAQAALIKSEKLAAAGRLAAILAHEINNPLQAITNLMSLLQQSRGLDQQERAYATMASEALDRVIHMTRQSLNFYREPVSAVAVNVEEAINSVLALYATRLATREICVKKRYKSTKTIQSYVGEIRQVFSTLLVNAMEAVPNGGTISIHVGNSFDRKNPSIHGIRILILDTGVGIPAANIARIFEPFFTTKGQQGVGLGLWVTMGIVSRLGGSIRVRSSARPGKSGTCFSIFLPNQMPTAV